VHQLHGRGGGEGPLRVTAGGLANEEAEEGAQALAPFGLDGREALVNPIMP